MEGGSNAGQGPQEQEAAHREAGGEPGFDERAWWTLGEASERADVAHRTLVDWMADGTLPFREAWREGSSVRVVLAGDLARLVPVVRGWRPEGSTSSLETRALHVGEPHSELGVPRRSEEGEGDSALELDPPEDERPYEAELRREVERLRREVRELRATRGELQAELQRSELLRDRDRQTAERAAAGGVSMAPASDGGERALTAWSAAVAGIALGLAGAVLWSQTGGGIVEAAPRTGPVMRANTESTADTSTAAAPELPLPFEQALDGEDSIEPAAQVSGAEAASVDSQRMELGMESGTEPGVDPAADPVMSVPVEPMGPELPAEAAAPPAFPVTLAQVDPTAFLSRGHEESSCAFAVLWDEDGERYRAALGPCIGGHNTLGIARGSHRVDGAACCAHHAFVERMTSASRDVAALQGILEEADAARADGMVPPLVRLRAERSAKRFLEHALENELGRGAWSAAGLDDGTGDHLWEPDPSGDPMKLFLVSWVRMDEGEPLRAYRLELVLDDGPEGDRALSFGWLER